MKILVFSDIHGSLFFTKKIIERIISEQPDQLIVLGDIMYHGPRNPLPLEYDPLEVSVLLNKYADRIIGVRGNCDAEIDQSLLAYDAGGDYQKAVLNHRTFFVTHGHIYQPDNHPVLPDGSIFLSGHTHLPDIHETSGIYYLNPGSIALPKGDNPPSYGLIDEERLIIQDFAGNIIREMKIV